MPLANPPLVVGVPTSWSIRSWAADLAGCRADELELEYAGRWPGETRARYVKAGQPFMTASIIHPGSSRTSWLVRATFVDGAEEEIDIPGDVAVDY